MYRHDCAACGGALLNFLDLGSTPLADKFPRTPDEQERWYGLHVAVCEACWLVQLREVVPDRELYGEDYGFRTGASPAAVRYFTAVAHDLMERYPEQCSGGVTEIAGNDGTLLRRFRDRQYQTMNIEPSAAAGDAREISGVGTVKEPFTAELARSIAEYQKSGLVLAFNVVAHVTDPRDFLTGIGYLLREDGLAVVEFQDLNALIAGCQFDHVYHEHRFYYSLSTFGTLAAECGLVMLDWERTPAQGGSLRVHLYKRRDPGIHVADPWLEDIRTYETFQDRVVYVKRGLLHLIGQELGSGRVIAGYGASAKSATLLNYCKLHPRRVQWIEDLTPGKIGRFTPGMKIPIWEPGTKPDTYLLTSWNYAGAMIRQQSDFLANGGRVIVPAPVPVML